MEQLPGNSNSAVQPMTLSQRISQHKLFYLGFLVILLWTQTYKPDGLSLYIFTSLFGRESLLGLSALPRLFIISSLILFIKRPWLKLFTGSMIIFLLEFGFVLAWTLMNPSSEVGLGILSIAVITIADILIFWLLVYVESNRGRKLSTALFLILLGLSLVFLIGQLPAKLSGYQLANQQQSIRDRITSGELSTFDDVERECGVLDNDHPPVCDYEEIAIKMGDPRICELRFKDTEYSVIASSCAMKVLHTREEKVDYCNKKESPVMRQNCLQVIK